MKITPLNQVHKDSKAKMVEYAGYEMPLSYGNIKDEYTAVREKHGIFDVSHMQVLKITSQTDAAKDLLNFVTIRNVAKAKPGKVQYNVIINENGGILDDITVYRIDENNYYMVSNAARAEIILSHLKKNQKERFPEAVIETFEGYTLVALQGPQSEKALLSQYPAFKESIEDVPYYGFFQAPELGAGAFIARTGYTGEDGFEIFTPGEEGKKLWAGLQNNGAALCGLASRDLLRMEVFYPLYGNELSEEITPYEASLDRLVDESKEFYGKESLLAKKSAVKRSVKGIIMENPGAIPRHGYKVFDGEGNEIGEITSGGFSFIWNLGFGLCMVDKTFSDQDTVYVEIRKEKKPGKLQVKSPIKGSIKRKNG